MAVMSSWLRAATCCRWHSRTSHTSSSTSQASFKEGEDPNPFKGEGQTKRAEKPKNRKPILRDLDSSIIRFLDNSKINKSNVTGRSKESYKHYREAKQEMTDFATAKYDIERFLNLSQEESQHQEQEKEKQKKQNKSR